MVIFELEISRAHYLLQKVVIFFSSFEVMLNQTSVDMLNCNLLLPMTSFICLYTYVRVYVCIHIIFISLLS